MVLQAIAKLAGEWAGRAEVKFTHASAPMAVHDRATGAETDLLKVCEQATPPCNINPLLFNGHLQTMWTATKPHGPPVHYRRRVFDADHASYKGSFAVDFVVPPPADARGAAGLGEDRPGEGGDRKDVPAGEGEGVFVEGAPSGGAAAAAANGTADGDGANKNSGPLPRRTAWFTEAEWAALPSDDARPMLVVLHGLSGGSHEVYLRHAIEPLIRSGRWEIIVVNSRGCAWSRITSGVLYNARATWDVRQVVRWLKKTFPNRPLFGLGFSLGANILTNYVGEEGSNCVFKAALICSNPFNLEVCSKIMQSSFIGKEVYLRVMGMAMYELANKHKKEIQDWTDVDWDVIERMKYLNEFDREVQCKCWGYPTEYAYYRDASSSDAVTAIRIPFFALHARDDPIAPDAAVPYEEFAANPCTVLCTTSIGGHLSWFESSGGRWYAKPVCNFLNYMAFEADLDKLGPLETPAGNAAKHGHHFEPMRRRMQIHDGESTE